VNTFLPYADYAQSARCLDRQRLGKQRVEVLTLLRGKWPNHPASRMWRGYEASLAWYGMCVCNEWLLRGYKDACFPLIREHYVCDAPPPPWLGREDVHAAYRSNLLRKDTVFYSQFGWSEPLNLPYVWPLP